MMFRTTGMLWLYLASSLTAFSQATRIALVDGDMFLDEKAGIRRLVVAQGAAAPEGGSELVALKTKIERLSTELGREVKQLGPEARLDSIQAKAKELTRLTQEFDQKASVQKDAFDRRFAELAGPAYRDIFAALREYARLRGFDVVIDISKLNAAVMVINPGIDITAAFILDYNAKNPLPTAPKP